MSAMASLASLMTSTARWKELRRYRITQKRITVASAQIQPWHTNQNKSTRGNTRETKEVRRIEREQEKKVEKARESTTKRGRCENEKRQDDKEAMRCYRWSWNAERDTKSEEKMKRSRRKRNTRTISATRMANSHAKQNRAKWPLLSRFIASFLPSGKPSIASHRLDRDSPVWKPHSPKWKKYTWSTQPLNAWTRKKEQGKSPSCLLSNFALAINAPASLIRTNQSKSRWEYCKRNKVRMPSKTEYTAIQWAKQ